MHVSVTLDVTGRHPLFAVNTRPTSSTRSGTGTSLTPDAEAEAEVSGETTTVGQIALRFAAYRDFQTKIVSLLGSVRIESPFPETKSQSAFGIQLNTEQLEERRAKLERYMLEVIDRFQEFPNTVQTEILLFLKATNSYEEHLRKENETEKATAVSPQPSITKNTSLSQKLLNITQTSKSKDNSTQNSSRVINDEKQQQLYIQVSRGSTQNHIRFDVIVRLKDIPITLCMRQFKEYRYLYQSLASDILKLQTNNHVQFPVFPVTYDKSSFGMALTETEIISRVSGLDNWVRHLARFFHLLPLNSQDKVENFFNLDCLVHNEEAQPLIQARLRSGQVYIPVEDTTGWPTEPMRTVVCLAGGQGGEDGTKESKGVSYIQVTAAEKQPVVENNGGGVLTEEGELAAIERHLNRKPKGCCVVS